MNDDSLLLRMEGIVKRFGATRALAGVSLLVRPGEVMALVGENGAGKSTLVKILAGALRPDAGNMRLAGATYQPAGPLDARRRGVAMIYQELTLAPELSVEDNIMLGQECGRWGILDRAAQRPRVRQALALLGHPELRPEALVSSLSVGAQQLVEIARALVQQARLIVFDEPTSSLGRHDVDHLFRVIGLLRAQGLGIVYISHFLEEIRAVCDRYTVLRDGQTVGAGELAGAREEQIVALMVGRSVDELFPKLPHTPGAPLLSLAGLSGRKLPHDVSLTLRRGEIFGIAGLVGAGRTELLRTILALNPTTAGTLHVAGAVLAGSPRERIRAGLGMVSEDRKGEGLAQDRSIADNLTYSRLAPYTRWGIVNLNRRRRAVARWIDRLSIKARSAEQEVSALSGGNQQKVAIARVLHQAADVLLLDEPTRGIDVGTKAEIYRLIGELAVQGKAVLMVSSYLPELLAICDTIGVMGRGRLREVRPANQWTEESIMACAVGLEDTNQEGTAG
jgi:ribose transport system ATP-binding protein